MVVGVSVDLHVARQLNAYPACEMEMKYSKHIDDGITCEKKEEGSDSAAVSDVINKRR